MLRKLAEYDNQKSGLASTAGSTAGGAKSIIQPYATTNNGLNSASGQDNTQITEAGTFPQQLDPQPNVEVQEQLQESLQERQPDQDELMAQNQHQSDNDDGDDDMVGEHEDENPNHEQDEDNINNHKSPSQSNSQDESDSTS